MRPEENNIDSTAEHLKKILEIRYRLIKIRLVEKTAKVSASIVNSFFTWVMLFLCILFVSIALAFIISDYTGQTYMGFAVMAVFYLIIFISMVASKKQFLRKGLINFFINKMFDND